MIRSRLTAAHPFGARRFASVQNAYKPSAFFKLFVAEELLDETDVGTAFEEVDGSGMANQMTAPGAADVGLLEPFADHTAEYIGVEGLAVAG